MEFLTRFLKQNIISWWWQTTLDCSKIKKKSENESRQMMNCRNSMVVLRGVLLVFNVDVASLRKWIASLRSLVYNLQHESLEKWRTLRFARKPWLYAWLSICTLINNRLVIFRKRSNYVRCFDKKMHSAGEIEGMYTRKS